MSFSDVYYGFFLDGDCALVDYFSVVHCDYGSVVDECVHVWALLFLLWCVVIRSVVPAVMNMASKNPWGSMRSKPIIMSPTPMVSVFSILFPQF